MGRLLKTSTIYFSCVFILCFCCFLSRSWIDTTQYNALSYLQPILYQWVSGEKTKGLYNETVLIKSDAKTVSIKSDAKCINKYGRLSKTALPLTGLVSFPGSGNTWTRHLIQQMTGIGTSSVYCDVQLREGGFPYECHRHRNKTIVIKTHEPKHIPLFTKIIFLIRNPYDAILSYKIFITSGHTNHASENKLHLALIKSFEESRIKYLNIARQIIQRFKGPVHVLQYEKLKTNMATELRKVADFLGANVTEHDIKCTVKLQEGDFHRNTTDESHIKLLKSVYSTDMRLDLQETARDMERLLNGAYGVVVDLSGPEKQLNLNAKE